MIFSKNQGFLKLPKLFAPTISVDGTIVTISNFESNGDFAQYWLLYRVGWANPFMQRPITSTQFDMFAELMMYGTQEIYAVVVGEGFNRSDSSNVIEVVEQRS